MQQSSGFKCDYPEVLLSGGKSGSRWMDRRKSFIEHATLNYVIRREYTSPDSVIIRMCVGDIQVMRPLISRGGQTALIPTSRFMGHSFIT